MLNCHSLVINQIYIITASKRRVMHVKQYFWIHPWPFSQCFRTLYPSNTGHSFYKENERVFKVMEISIFVFLFMFCTIIVFNVYSIKAILKTISAKMSSQRLDMTFDFSHEGFCSEKVNYHLITGSFIFNLNSHRAKVQGRLRHICFEILFP